MLTENVKRAVEFDLQVSIEKVTEAPKLQVEFTETEIMIIEMYCPYVIEHKGLDRFKIHNTDGLKKQIDSVQRPILAYQFPPRDSRLETSTGSCGN